MVSEMVSEWLETKPTSTDSHDITALREWTQHTSDVHFASHALLANDLFSALALFVKGMRRNLYTVYNAGRKTMMPLMPLLNHGLYARYEYRDLFEYGFACTAEIAAEHKMHFQY
jgi:hypothetical protein